MDYARTCTLPTLLICTGQGSGWGFSSASLVTIAGYLRGGQQIKWEEWDSTDAFLMVLHQHFLIS